MFNGGEITQREILLKMLSAEAKIPADVLEVLGIQTDQKLLITLYTDKTVTIEPAPTPKPAKPTVEPTVKAKRTLPTIPKDWIQIGKTRWLTPEGAINRIVKGQLLRFISMKKVRQVAEVIKGSPSRSEAIKTLMEKLQFNKNTATTYYGIVKRSIPHLEKMKTIPEGEKPAPVTGAPK